MRGNELWRAAVAKQKQKPKQRHFSKTRRGSGLAVTSSKGIESPAPWVGCDQLRTEWGMDTQHLVTFMKRSAAARIDKPKDKFWVALRFELCFIIPDVVRTVKT